MPTLAGTDLEGAELYEYVGASVNNPGGGYRTLNLEISEVHSINAGVPYLIRWNNTGEVIRELNFSNVEIRNRLRVSVGSADNVQLIGHVAREKIYDDANHSRLFIGAEDKLFWPLPDDDTTTKGFRAYFYVPTGNSSNANSTVRGMPARLVIRRNAPTDAQIVMEQDECMKVIEDGALYILRGGKKYNAQGMKTNE